MLKTRVIPVLFLMNGLIVRSENFSEFKVIGNPINQLERLNDWLADELIYIDITRSGNYDLRRDDMKLKGAKDVLGILRQISKTAFMPLTFGGRINSIKDVDKFIRNGADKVLINSQAYHQPELVSETARKYGSQALVIGLDVRRESGRHSMYVDQGRSRVDESPVDYARKAEERGAGEIMVKSIDRDGSADGYDTEIIRSVVEAVQIPVIACGGVGTFDHFRPGLDDGGATAVAAGNIFHFTEHAYKRAKMFLHRRGYNVRNPYSS